MTQLTSNDGDDLRQWLAHVNEKDTTEFLLLGITYDEGVSTADLATWYGYSPTEIDDLIDELESDPLVLSIATREGVDFDRLAKASGLSRETVVEWFVTLESEPVQRAAEIIQRYSRHTPGPLLTGTESRVHYIDYDVVEEQGWSIDDTDLFDKAAQEDLELAEYGRFLVQPGQSILDAAEQGGRSWPYACRGGACANCAVIVKEGDVAMPGQSILTDEQVRVTNARLTCVGVPVTEEVKLVMNVQQLDQFQDLRLPSPTTDSSSI